MRRVGHSQGAQGIHHRWQAVQRAQRVLQSRGHPRTQMLLMVSLTGAFGWLVSLLMLLLGVSSMALRYPLAVVAAYGCFLLMLTAWLRHREWPGGAGDLGDLALERDNAAPDLAPLRSGGGGDFGGGGASASLDGPKADAFDTQDMADTADTGNALDVVGEAANAEEFAIPLLVVLAAVVLVAALALAGVYVVWIAPQLLAEILVDGVLVVALLRPLSGRDPQHWLTGAVRRTLLPFVVTALALSAAGALLAYAAPGARTFSAAIQLLAH